uniref:Peptidase C-terminal archaeal/bacterial domain-containing protein n=1 Tax=Tetradesmus obliquus TaxID=3088 RepID=A0A383VZQ1_TETOB|eukprot:jgi/Sobl393_1/8748/SZX70701.1
MAAAAAALRHTAGLEQQQQQQQQGPWAATASGPLGLGDVPSSISVSEAFKLSSRPGSKFKIVLDFDGNVLRGSQWNVIQGADKIVTGPYDKDGDPSTFNAEEIADIVAIWRAVAEDYAPFDVDVTTLDPGDAALQGVGQKAIIYEDENSVSGNDAGIAFIGSFGQGAPAFVCARKLGPNNPKFIWEAVSHEVGHTLGLLHDGVAPNPSKPAGDPYYQGQGNWAPIMGVAFYMQVTQFDAGEYAYASNLQDDLAVIGKFLPRLPQQAGNSFASAVPLTASSVTNGRASASRDGALTLSGQTDYMFFGADAGPATISVAVTPPFGKVPNNRANLKAAVALYNEQGVLLQSLQPSALAMSAPAANVQLPSKGIYYVAVSGAGEGIPKAEGYSSYGSLGWYTTALFNRGPAAAAAV